MKQTGAQVSEDQSQLQFLLPQKLVVLKICLIGIDFVWIDFLQSSHFYGCSVSSSSSDWMKASNYWPWFCILHFNVLLLLLCLHIWSSAPSITHSSEHKPDLWPHLGSVSSEAAMFVSCSDVAEMTVIIQAVWSHRVGAWPLALTFPLISHLSGFSPDVGRPGNIFHNSLICCFKGKFIPQTFLNCISK